MVTLALSASFVVLFACSWIFVLCEEPQELTVKPGEDATLQCLSERRGDITVIEWIRTDLKTDDGFVFFLSPEAINGEYQNSFFQGRVELRDPKMKDGDASVILKNVNINDTGTYECSIAVTNSGRRKRAVPEPISTIKLTVPRTQELKVTAGEDATLQCLSERGGDITVIEWIRTDLKTDDFVFFLSPETINGEYQNSFFQGRVELRDPKMKDGEASVILKNVNINDTGTYECRVKERKERGKSTLISIIRLTMTEPDHTAGHKEGGDKEGNVGLKVGVIVFAVLLVAVVGVIICKKRRGKTLHTGGETYSLNPPPSILTHPGHTTGHKEGGDKEGGDKEGGDKEGED